MTEQAIEGNLSFPVVEYHIEKGGAVFRLFESEEDQQKEVKTFSGTKRTGVASWEEFDYKNGRKIFTVLPYEQVKTVRSYLATQEEAVAMGLVAETTEAA